MATVSSKKKPSLLQRTVPEILYNSLRQHRFCPVAIFIDGNHHHFVVGF